MAIEILTPPGRIVWGHPLEKTIKTDPQTRKPILKDGKEQDVWAYGLAIPNAQFGPVEQAIAQAGYQQYPNGNFPVDRHGNPDFAWKIVRGDTDFDSDRKPYRDREGYAGHTIIAVSTQAFCPPAYKFEAATGQYRQLTEKEIKCGDWGVAKLSIASHPGGIYINPVLFELVGYDKEIVRRAAANPMEHLGGRTYQLPAGVSATPVGGAPAGVAMPQTMPAHGGIPGGQPQYQPAAAPAPQQNYGVPGGQQYAPAAPAPTAYPAGVASQPAVHAAPMPAPAHDFVNNAIGQQPSMPSPQPVAAPSAQHPQAPQQYGIPGGMAGIPQGR